MEEFSTLHLKKKVFITGEIVIKTGIHIGGSSIGLQIGGANKVVIRHPLTNLPYIPGSSLKGKMRSLLEKSEGLIAIKSSDKDGKKVWEGKLCEDPEKDVVQLFGAPAEVQGKKSSHAPTRLTVRDGNLINIGELEAAENTDMYCTEIKTEVSIDRLTAQANPRNFERVPSGARFGLEMVLDIYNVDESDGEGESDTDRARRFTRLIRQGLLLVQDDYLGGQGTRGYGQVAFLVKSVLEKTAEDYRNNTAGKESPSLQEIFACFPKELPAEARP